MKKPSIQQLKQLERDNARYTDELAEIPYEQWRGEQRGQNGAGDVLMRVWRSKRFLVQLYAQKRGQALRLSVNRTDWDRKAKRFSENITWDELQQLKREAGYGDACAVEVFPPDAHEINVANMRHLFLLPTCPPFAWRID